MGSGIKKAKPKLEKKKEQDFRERGMYSSITIEGFRRFDHLELNDLSRINLILGDNNSGKTSVLEAVFAHMNGLSFTPFMRGAIFSRQISVTGLLDFGEKIKGLFHDTSTLPYTFSISATMLNDPKAHVITSVFKPSIELSDLDPRTLGKAQAFDRVLDEQLDNLSINVFPMDSINLTRQNLPQPVSAGIWETCLGGKTKGFNLMYPPSFTVEQTAFKAGLIHGIIGHKENQSEIRVFSYLKRYRILGEFAEEMRIAFPEIKEIDMIPYPYGQGPVSITTNDGNIIPLFLFGDGMRRWFYLLGHMVVFRKAVHLIDEVDAFFHPSAQSEFSKLLLKYVEKYDNQIFMTSHSIEFADNFLEALYGDNGVVAKEDEDPVRVITLRLTEDPKDVEVWRFTGREAYESRIKYNLELR
jgi:hypothetical protein